MTSTRCSTSCLQLRSAAVMATEAAVRSRGRGLHVEFQAHSLTECFHARVCTSPSLHSRSNSCPRAEELAPGGMLALLCTARRDRAHPEVQLPDDTMNFILVLEKAWKELINEGVVAEELLDSFNIAQCSPSVGEIQEAIELPTSAFHIQKLESIDAFRPFPDDAEDTIFQDAQSFANLFTSASKSSGTGSMLNVHLGPELTDTLLERTRQNLEKDYPKWKVVHFSITLRLCMAILIRM